MKQFFKFFFASLLGSLISAIIIFFILLGIFVSVISYAEKDIVKVEPNSVLYMKLNYPIMDRTPESPFSSFSLSDFSLDTPPGLADILKNIEKAKADPNINGIYMDVSLIPAGYSTLQEIRSALESFKESGKFILCYGDFYSQGAYYLASVADEVYLNPEGMIWFKGLNAEVMFIKGTLEKLGVDAQVIRSGKYKSAVEMFLREDLSEANKTQLSELISSIWNQVLIDISASRNISIRDLDMNADNLALFNASMALQYNFIDGLKYKDEVIDLLRQKTGIAKTEKIKSVGLSKYTFINVKKGPEKKKFTRDKIAILFAQGEIVMGGNDDYEINANSFAKAISQAGEDKYVKAIVLRVNSPGGSLLASEIIRREVALAVKKKPVVVSMGDVAASGGYWISCNASKILAEKTSITGSIGVYAVLPNFKGLLNEKLGITFDHVMTNDNADFLSTTKPLSKFQAAVIQHEIDKDYAQFIELVSESRKLKLSHVDSIAQGRVWSGVDAKKIGLIDDFGGLQKAIEEAALLANLKNFRIENLPVLSDPFQQLFRSMFDEAHVSPIKEKLGHNFKYYQFLKSISESEGTQARIPYYLEVE